MQIIIGLQHHHAPVTTGTMYFSQPLVDAIQYRNNLNPVNYRSGFLMANLTYHEAEQGRADIITPSWPWCKKVDSM